MSLFRLADLMCGYHRTLILDTRLWPGDYIPGNHNPGNNNCYDCGEVGSRMPSGRMAPALPGVDMVEEAAVHEAGHAVAYLVQGVTVNCAVLEPGDMPGWNAYVNVDLRWDLYGTPPHLIGLWAGQAASRRWLILMRALDDAALIDVVCNSGHDGQMLIEHAPHRRDIDDARGWADEMVERHWPAVERIADTLLARGRLTGDEIAELAGFGCGVR